jgi:hypothetical protein
VLIGYIERVPQESNICRLQSLESLEREKSWSAKQLGECCSGVTNRRKISILQPKDSGFASSYTVGRPALHIDYDDQLDTSVGHPSVHCDSLIERVQKAKVMANGLRGYPSFEDVQAGVEHE